MELLPSIGKDALLAMGNRDLTSAIESIYKYFGEMRPEFDEFSGYRGQEERLVWHRLEEAAQKSA